MPGLDHSLGCVNFRDVSVSLSLLADPAPIRPGQLLRGGKLDGVARWSDIDSPQTVINLRGGPDPADVPAQRIHLPRPNTADVYRTEGRDVRRWLNAVVSAFAGAEAPVLLHCTSGKDRTGVAVAALLSIAGVPEPLIVDEYLLSDGEVRRDWIAAALAGIRGRPDYFSRAGDAAVYAARRRLIGG